MTSTVTGRSPWHRCTTRHRTYRMVAHCRWPHAAWVTGEGRWAVLAHCRALTVTLHPTLERAARAKRLIDTDACGGRCHRDHDLVDLHPELDHRTPAQARARRGDTS